MSQTRDNFTENLKEVWEPAFAEFLNNSDRTRAQFEKSSRGVVEGKWVKSSAHIGRNSGFAFVPEGGQTPTPGHQSFMNTMVTLKKAISRIKLSTEVIEDSANDTAAVADAMSVEKDGAGKDARRELNFLLHSVGNGVIATCKTTSASTTVNLADATPKSVMRYLYDVVAAGGTDSGLYITAGTLANPVLRTTGVLVTDVDVNNRTVTVASAITTAGTDFIYRKGNGGTGANQIAPNSLRQIIDDTSVLHGADPATYKLWKSTVIDGGGEAATEGVFEEAFDLLDIATGEVYGDSSALVVTTHAIRKELASSMQDRVRYQPLELKGGFKSNMTIQAAGGPVGLLVDRDCIDHTAYLVDPDSIVRIVGKEWEFVEQSGSSLIYNIDDDSVHLAMRTRFEYLCKNRRSNARVDNLGSLAAY